MLIGILKGAPIWVWPLFVLLLWLGLKATRDRTSHVVGFYALPLLVVLTILRIAGFPDPVVVWACFVLAYLGGFALGYRAQGGRIVGKNATEVTLRGDWMTLIIVMVIFWSSFANGVIAAIAPTLRASVYYGPIFAIIGGLASGDLAGRALRVWQWPGQPT